MLPEFKNNNKTVERKNKRQSSQPGPCLLKRGEGENVVLSADPPDSLRLTFLKTSWLKFSIEAKNEITSLPISKYPSGML